METRLDGYRGGLNDVMVIHDDDADADKKVKDGGL